MTQLIPFEQRHIGTKATDTVNARDLYDFLEVKTQFSDWIARRIEQYGFLQDIDFIRYSELSIDNPKPPIDYFLTFDMAKQLSMVERNAKGREARMYFIACERVALSQTPGTPAPAPTLPSQESQLAVIQTSLSILERLGQLTPRDELMYADYTRNVMVSGQRLLTPPHSTAHGFSVAERCVHLCYRLTRKQQATFLPILGKLLAKEHRERTGTEPHKETRFVDGANRPVAWYAETDGAWVDPIIQSYLAGFPGLPKSLSVTEEIP